jgi:hypothetical protein
MPMHDWTRVEAGISHNFHQGWITRLTDSLNEQVLSPDYYALQEQQAAGFGPDVLTLQGRTGSGEETGEGNHSTGTMIRTRPGTKFTAETNAEFYRRKKSSIEVRHISGDRIVAMLEIVSPGNKSSGHAFQAFVAKACELLEHRIHLLIVDPFPPGKRDPNGIHAAIWEETKDAAFVLPKEKPLALAAYECDLTTRAWVETIAVGDPLPEMPLFLEPNCHVRVPLEATYQAAFKAMPRRWRDVLE